VSDWLVTAKLRGTAVVVVVSVTCKTNSRENGKHNTKQQQLENNNKTSKDYQLLAPKTQDT
jgi:hypothetical protein